MGGHAREVRGTRCAAARQRGHGGAAGAGERFRIGPGAVADASHPGPARSRCGAARGPACAGGVLIPADLENGEAPHGAHSLS